MSEEILEIGADGCFEIPQVKVTASPPAAVFVDVPKTTFAVPETSSGSLFKRISNGEYKVIKEGDTHINVIICLDDGLIGTRFRLSDKLLVVEISDGRKVQIELPILVKANSASSKYFNNYLVIKLELL